MVERQCKRCGNAFNTTASAANRADRAGAPLYCSRMCAGLARRVFRLPEEKRARKSEYDKARRAAIGDKLRTQKRETRFANHAEHLRIEAERRRLPHVKQAHRDYIKRPEYKAKKRVYDESKRKEEYGEFADAWQLLLQLEKEIRSQATSYERRVANGYYTRSAQRRRRELCRLNKLNSMPAI